MDHVIIIYIIVRVINKRSNCNYWLWAKLYFLNIYIYIYIYIYIQRIQKIHKKYMVDVITWQVIDFSNKGFGPTEITEMCFLVSFATAINNHRPNEFVWSVTTGPADSGSISLFVSFFRDTKKHFSYHMHQ